LLGIEEYNNFTILIQRFILSRRQNKMATEKRLIDANALSDLLDLEYKRKMDLVKKGEIHLNTLAEGFMSIANVIGTMSILDAVEVVHGRWIDVSLSFTHPKEKCSVCGGIVYAYGFNYCPNCGAKMEGQ
jgi:hypothetical protein